MPHIPHFTTSACVEVLAMTLKVGSLISNKENTLSLRSGLKCTRLIGKRGDTLQTSLALHTRSTETRCNLLSLSFILRSEFFSQVFWLINLSMKTPPNFLSEHFIIFASLDRFCHTPRQFFS